jgi:hypothetical protein
MSSQPMHCCITVRGRIAPHWSRWLEELRLSYRSSENGDEVTDLNGTVPDQSALQSVLNRIWNLNLTVLSVKTSAEARREGTPGAS